MAAASSLKQGAGLGNSTSQVAETACGARARVDVRRCACTYTMRICASSICVARLRTACIRTACMCTCPCVGRTAVAQVGGHAALGGCTAGGRAGQPGWQGRAQLGQPCTCRGDHAAHRRSRRLPVAHVRRVHSRQSHRSARPARSCPARTRRAHVAVITRRSRRLPGGTCRAHVGRGRARWFGVTTSLTLAGRCGRSACRPSGLQIEAAAATAVMWGVYYLRACVCVCAWCCAHACASVHMRSCARACRHARTRKHVRAHTHT
jgi:hypothetical protein